MNTEQSFQTPLLLTAAQVAERLGGGVSVRSVWRWTEQGKFPKPVHLGGRTLWKRRDVERFIDEAEGSLRKFNRIRRGQE